MSAWRFLFAVMSLFIVLLAPVASIACMGKHNDDIIAYYEAMRQRCGADSCCLASVQEMQKNGFEEASSSGCPEKVKQNRLSCSGSLSWCEQRTKNIWECQ